MRLNEFTKPKITGLTLDNFKSKMVEAAKKAGTLWEDFGQDEIRALRERMD